jgi:hypothetical protein
MPAWPSSRQAAEKALHLCSQLIKILNVARGYASGFVSPAAAVDGFLSSLRNHEKPHAAVVLASLKSLNVPNGYASVPRSLRPSRTVILTVLQGSC